MPTERHGDSFSTREARKPRAHNDRIALCIQDQQQERSLAASLCGNYRVYTGVDKDASLNGYDLIITDPNRLSQLHKQLRSSKQIEAPLFLPVLLIAPRAELAQAHRWGRQVVDECLGAPFEKFELRGRAAMLLRARHLSIALYREVHEERDRIDDQYRVIVETAEEGIWMIDQNNETRFVNQKMAALLGYTVEEMHGRSLYDFTDEEMHAVADHHVQRRRAGIREQHEFRFKHKNGDDLWALVATNPLLDKQGRYTGALAMVTDITYRKHAEQTMRSREQMLRFALEAARAGAWQWEIDTNQVTWSDENYRLMGLEPGACAASYANWLQRVHPDDRASTEIKVSAAVESRTDLDVEFRVVWPDGSIRWINDVGRLVYDSEQRPIGMYGLQIDVSERKRTEQALSERERFLRTMIESEPHCVLLLDPDARVVQINAAGLALIEADNTKEIEAQSILPIIADEHRDDFAATVRHVFEGHADQLEYEIVGRKGARRWLETHAVPLRDPDGNVRHLLAITRDVTAQRQAQDQLGYLAYHDVLTGLPNRVLFNDHLNQAMAAARRDGRLVAVLYLDLDHFKNINDTMGHDAGDELLKDVAQRLSGTIRTGDTVSRHGGDEFSIVLAGAQRRTDVAQVAGKILKVLRPPFILNGQEIFITASVGITLFPADGDEPAVLLRNADAAMYHAKAGGRNTFAFFSAKMHAAASERMVLGNALQMAPQRGELVLHYQPQFQLSTGHIVGAEALLRWNHPRRGLTPPAQFIPLAEEIGIIHSIGDWVLETACHRLAQWHAQGMPIQRISVNISARQLHCPDFIQRLATLLADTRLAPGSLDLELTESELLEHADFTMSVLRKLSGLGVGIAVDDFGTGYSSLSYLKRFPVKTLKIDRSFVRDIPQDSNDMAIAKAIAAMAHSLGLNVIAEGVETAAQMQVLKDLRCEEVQGYYLSRPLDEHEFSAFIQSRESCLSQSS